MKDLEGLSNNVASQVKPAQRQPDFLLAEFSALRAEMLKRIELQHQLIVAALVAAGTFLTVSVTRPVTGPTTGPVNISLAFPIFALFFAAAWSQNDLRIWQMGKYIRKRIEGEFLGSDMGWESIQATSRVGGFGSLSLFSSRGILVGTQILTVVAALFTATFSQLEIVLFIVDAIIILITILLLWRRGQKNFEEGIKFSPQNAFLIP